MKVEFEGDIVAPMVYDCIKCDYKTFVGSSLQKHLFTHEDTLDNVSNEGLESDIDLNVYGVDCHELVEDKQSPQSNLS